MIDLFPLEDGLRKPVETHVLEKEAKGGNHGHQPKILGGEKPRQDDGGDHLDGQAQALTTQRNAGAPHGEAPERVPGRDGSECAILVEGPHHSLVLTTRFRNGGYAQLESDPPVVHHLGVAPRFRQSARGHLGSRKARWRSSKVSILWISVV